MYNLSVADVDGYMSDAAASVVEEEVAGLQGIQGYRCAASGLGCRVMRETNSEVSHDCHGEAGAVRAAGKACAAVYIRISDELAGVICDCLSCRGNRRSRSGFFVSLCLGGTGSLAGGGSLNGAAVAVETCCSIVCGVLSMYICLISCLSRCCPEQGPLVQRSRRRVFIPEGRVQSPQGSPFAICCTDSAFGRDEI